MLQRRDDVRPNCEIGRTSLSDGTLRFAIEQPTYHGNRLQLCPGVSTIEIAVWAEYACNQVQTVIASCVSLNFSLDENRMVTTGYGNYFLRILFSSEQELGAAFSLVVEISQSEARKPIATLCLNEPIADEREGILRGFELGRQWIAKTSPQLSSPIGLANRTIVHSAELVAELDHAISNSFGSVARSENLIRRSRNLSIAATAQRCGCAGNAVLPPDWQRSLGCTRLMPPHLIAEHLAQRALTASKL